MDIVQEMVTEMLNCERFTTQDFRNRWQYPDVTFNLMLSKAFDRLRNDHRIEMRPDAFGTYRRADYQEARQRGERRARKGRKAFARAITCLEIAAENAPEEQRESIRRQADLKKLQLTAAGIRSRKRLSAA